MALQKGVGNIEARETRDAFLNPAPSRPHENVLPLLPSGTLAQLSVEQLFREGHAFVLSMGLASCA
jgi:hypothetical protein